MFASIIGQNSANLKGGKRGRQSYHTGTYFFPFQALCATKETTKVEYS